MKLEAPFIRLPLHFDAESLAAEIHALGREYWRPHPQGFAGNSMLPLIAVDGEPSNEAFSGKMKPTPALLKCGYMMQVLNSFGATLGRTRLMRLAGQAEVTRHIDQGYYWADRVRVHVPIITQPTVMFECGDTTINMGPGECWIFDTWRQHRVVNDATQSRIHLVADTVGGDQFWKLVAEGVLSLAGSGAPRMVAPDKSVTPQLVCEVVNVPRVMTPWEMKAHFALLFGDAMPHPRMEEVQNICSHFVKAWHALWARFGEDSGADEYMELLSRFVADIRHPSETLQLQNGLLWFSAMGTLIAKAAVVSDRSK